MATQTRWTFHGFPLDPPLDDAEPSAFFTQLMDQAQQFINEHGDLAAIDRLAQEGKQAYTQPAPSNRQRFRFQFLLGKGYLQHQQWDQALSALTSCEPLLQPDDRVAAVLLYRHQALAAHQATHFDIAIRYYERLAAIWSHLLQEGQTDCLEEDPHAFLCNVLRQQSDCWLMLGAFTTAHSLLERQVYPIVIDAYEALPTSPSLPATNQSEINWRELRLFVPWHLDAIAGWQARLAPDAQTVDRDLDHATVLVLDAARISQQIPEGQQWSTDLYTAAAEILIQRCRFTAPQEVHGVICQRARDLLETAYRVRQPMESTKSEQLRQLVLQLPQYELRYCEILLDDEPEHLIPNVLDDVQALQLQAQADPDPGYQLLAVRCAWFAGNIEAWKSTKDPAAKSRAAAWYQQALDIIVSSTNFITLVERGIRADMEQLGVG